VDPFAFTSLMQATSGMDLGQQPEPSRQPVQELLEGRRVIAAVYTRPADQHHASTTDQQQQEQQWCVSHWKLA
jgi:hypothetical protein